ncbi:hypothetical protein MBANPS3_012409 [Mucor bainieri]
MTEVQFSEQAVLPLLLPLFAGRHQYEVSKYDKNMVTLSDYKPDLLILLKLKYNVKIDFFVCEIKKPGCTGNKYESDFVKVQREMKAIIDQQIDIGVNNPLCYGLLVEGFDCYFYQMSLEYESEYTNFTTNSSVSSKAAIAHQQSVFTEIFEGLFNTVCYWRTTLFFSDLAVLVGDVAECIVAFAMGKEVRKYQGHDTRTVVKNILVVDINSQEQFIQVDGSGIGWYIFGNEQKVLFSSFWHLFMEGMCNDNKVDLITKQELCANATVVDHAFLPERIVFSKMTLLRILRVSESIKSLVFLHTYNE